MKFEEIKEMVIREYDTRGLKSDVRYKALDDFDRILKSNKQLLELWNDVSKFPDNKNVMKAIYEKIKGKSLNSAQSSMINEVYNQLNKKKN